MEMTPPEACGTAKPIAIRCVAFPTNLYGLTPGSRAVLTLECKRMHKVRVRSQRRCSTDTGASPMPVSCFRWSARPTAPRKHLSVPPACTRPSLFGGD